MPRGGRLFISSTSMAILSSFPRLPCCSKLKVEIMCHKPLSVSSFKCSCSSQNELPRVDPLFNYKESFSNRMAMAGIRPHHRIALGVSGGPDSMALCVLAAAWKTDSLDAAATAGESNGFIDGLLAIIVDHGLRAESGEEARLVHQRVSNMGIRCEIAHCEWKGGRPTQGHLQEEARDMRYEIFQKACVQHQFGVLLIAHHADDQAELFIIRLSRNSSVLGLAGMAFTSELFSKYTHSHLKDDSSNGPRGILLVRPLLDFTKHDLYKICEESGQNWVEDPSNRKPIFVRNRIRMSLESSSSSIFKSEIQSLISMCRKTRSYVDKFCSDLVTRTVTVTDQGYAIIDLEALNPSCIDDICLAKFLAIVLQFISQRHRPVRGSTSKLVMDYIRTSPCKTCLTAAGCYLCPAPGSKGTKLLICCSVSCPPLPSSKLLTCCSEPKDFIVSKQLAEIIVQQAESSYAGRSFPGVHYFLGKASGSKTILSEAKRLNILSESTYSSIVSLQEEEHRLFKSNPSPGPSSSSPLDVVEQKKSEQLLHSGQIGNFMNRFFISWKKQKNTGHETCKFCQVGSSTALSVRPMEMSDWLYLAELSKCQNLEEDLQQISIRHAKASAETVLRLLKSIPVAARKSLPVLVNDDGVLVSIPSLGFKHCSCLDVYCRFKPRVPLGGGYTSFL